ncbi:uncharacterized protein PV07_10454 [Cladophialophora immunda]|uniref:Large ribosomal subunit protein uL6m n=1 Tax=Cladophialophora immunda TaxID=569365 RepID=A0A0D1ZAM0_9EURO|nr:uncharacterized protein PV07_10454 [Cladophialophora immunda]KIW24761.1 hypothetical protein PV07_10454 [Cladophialophora immunda]OQU97703.1 hypothetical protein CLAIMM_03594 [Cladophialophora immunda]
MACTNLQSSLRRLVREASRSGPREIPSFLVPALSRPFSARQASTLAAETQTPSHQSRIGRAPITIPPEVSLRFYELPKGNVRSRHPDTPNMALEVTGPLGQMTVPLPPYLQAELDDSAKKININVKDAAEKHQRAMWGTMRALVQNSVSGVSEGHLCILRLVGVGYRATIEDTAQTKTPQYPGQKFVNLKLGYAHPVEMGVPRGVKASTPQPTRILLEGCDKQVIKQFAAEIRAWRKPEPYKGKGIFVNDETIRLKAKKIK